MKFKNIAECPFEPTHIGNKKIRLIFFKKFAIAY